LEERFDVNFAEQDDVGLPADLAADLNGLPRFSGVSGISGLGSAADAFDNEGIDNEFDKEEHYSDDFDTDEPPRESLIIEDATNKFVEYSAVSLEGIKLTEKD